MKLLVKNSASLVFMAGLMASPANAHGDKLPLGDENV